MYYGIDVNYREFTVCRLDKNKNVNILSHFWKEGLYWFIDHYRPDILSVNLGFNEDSSKTKHAYELINKLRKDFEYIIADEEKIKNKEKKIIIKTSTDYFFKKIIRKELLPINTREGIEQRIYNLRKTGIKFDKKILSKDREKLKRELNAIISAFTSYSISNNSYEVIQDFDEKIIIPKYKFVPTSNRIKRRIKEEK